MTNEMIPFNLEEALKNPERVVYRNGEKPLEWHWFEHMPTEACIISIRNGQYWTNNKLGFYNNDESGCLVDLLLLPLPEKPHEKSMINANELRIGNIVLRAKWLQKAYTLPNEWEYDQIVVSHNDITACVVKPDHFKPIPLTPEILEKIGLKRDEEGWILDFDNKLYDPLGRNGTGGLSQRDTTVFAYKHTNSILKVGVRYLHQLENLYFALTGKELIFKPQNK